MLLRRPIRALVIALALLLAPAIAIAGDARYAAMVIDANTGEVLHADQADEPRHPASLTKMMTLYMAFEAIERGRASYATRIKISAQAAAAAPSKLDLDAGDDIALIDAMKALVTKSANDIAIAVAEHFGGSEAQFARMMTDKARALGMTGTVFKNASGLPDPGQITTARDMLTLSLRLYDDFPRHYTLFSLRSFTFQGSAYKSHNKLLANFAGTDGIKTGYTRMSGFNLVASVRRGGRHVIGAVFGGATADRRDDAMRLLLSRAIFKASPIRRRVPRPVLVAERAAPQRTAAAPAAGSPVVPAIAAPSRVEVVRVKPVPVPVPVPVSAPPRLRPAEPAAVGVAALPVPVPRPASRPDRGSGPSTLDQQAANLARGLPASEMPPPVRPGGVRVAEAPEQAIRLRGSVVATPAVARSDPGPGFEIQVGAFATLAEAQRTLTGVREKAGDLLGSAASRAVPVQKDNRQMFRARFAGFSATTAASTCEELRKRQVTCFVTKAD